MAIRLFSASLNLARFAPKTPILACSRLYSDIGPETLIDPHKGKVVNPDLTIPDQLGHAVGVERFELLAKAHGIEDPFEMASIVRTSGTLDDPNLIPSGALEKAVGCICHPDINIIKWWNLHKGEPKRCDCGYWFKMVKREPYAFLEEYGSETWKELAKHSDYDSEP